MREETRMNTNSNEKTDIISKLRKGSEELDRMRKEIQKISNMLVGRIRDTAYGPRNEVFKFSVDPKNYWEVRVDTDYDWATKLSIDLVVNPPKRRLYSRLHLVCGTGGKNMMFPVEEVEHVYDQLPVLINGLMEEFPGLFDPFLNAAEHAESKE